MKKEIIAFLGRIPWSEIKNSAQKPLLFIFLTFRQNKKFLGKFLQPSQYGKVFKAYLAVLNMNPGATGTIRNRKSHEYSIPESRPSRIWINILLFVITLITTTIAGAQTDESINALIISGLPFSITIMSILLSHEMGHYMAAKYFGVKTTLPYFIPFPSIIGTMGAVIKIKSPIPDKKSLLYIGAMGPVAGFIVSLAAVIAGIYISEIRPVPANTGGMMPVFGDSILFAFITKIIHGSIPAGHDIYLSPYAWAGWIGFLITSINLMPMGQLDGSHIVYAMTGRRQVFFGWTMFAGLVLLSFYWIGWIIWIIIALLFLMIGHPRIGGNDDPKISAGERLLGWSCMLIFILTFVPVPVKLI